MAKLTRVNIAVIGAGPKAASLAAKAFVMRKLGLANIHITIFESHEIGANWSGVAGYTDGQQQLCTAVERDVGFPYKADTGMSLFTKDVDVEMYAVFSWGSFLASSDEDYRLWIDKGRLPPTHGKFATYLAWVIERSEAQVIYSKVTRLLPKEKKWRVQKSSSGGYRDILQSSMNFDAVVVTGPGPARRLPGSEGAPNTFDGSDFWRNLDKVKKALQAPEADIAVIGAGGTAAAIVAWLARNERADRRIHLVVSQPALYSRGNSVFENSLFSDDGAWDALSVASRKEFVDRLTRGVVWSTVMDEVARAEGLALVTGRAQCVHVEKNKQLVVHVKQGNGNAIQLEPKVLIDATGFNAWWFLQLIPGCAGMNQAQRDELEVTLSEGLAFNGVHWQLPPLHAPLLSSVRGPGLGNLMSLGGMSDRILRDYMFN